MEKQNSRIGVYIPTLGRPDKLAPLASNIHETTFSPHSVYFVVEPDDTASIEAVKATGEQLVINKLPGTHTGAANTVYKETTEPFFIIANDDFWFHPSWDVHALEKMVDGVNVVAVNDTITDCLTTFLIRRSYIETQSGCMDVPDVVFFPGYHHNYVDTEFREVACKRGVFAKAPLSVVEHKHWTAGAKMDTTYQQSLQKDSVDAQTFRARRHLWA